MIRKMESVSSAARVLGKVLSNYLLTVVGRKRVCKCRLTTGLRSCKFRSLDRNAVCPLLLHVRGRKLVDTALQGSATKPGQGCCALARGNRRRLRLFVKH